MNRLRTIATWAFIVTLFLVAVSDAAEHEILRNVDALGAEARKLTFQGKYALGIARAREGLKLAEETFGANDARIYSPLLALADLLRESARYSEARALYQRAIKIVEVTRGPNDPFVGVALSRLAGLLIAIGDYKAAKPVAERAHGIIETGLHRSDERIAQSLNVLGRIALGAGDYVAAKPLFERALEIRQATRKFPPWLIARNFSLLGRVHMGLQDYDAARKFYQQALRLRERQLDPDYPEISQNLYHLGNLSRVTATSPPPKPFMSVPWRLPEKPALLNTVLIMPCDWEESMNKRSVLLTPCRCIKKPWVR